METMITATILDENGTECQQTFSIERQFSVAGKEYLALIPVEDDDMIYLFSFTKENDAITLVEIENDDEYEQVAAAYEGMMED